jgi:hypothetical protein
MKFSLKKYNPNHNKGLECLNCRQPLHGNENFCSYCGQKNSTSKLLFGNFIKTLFSGFLSYDSRLWQTFIPLITKPGQVSKEFIAGKRARFVNPFQLYFNVSIIFFLIFGISTTFNSDLFNNNPFQNTKTGLDSLSQQEKHQLDSIFKDVKGEIIKTTKKDSIIVKQKEITNLISDLSLVKPDSLIVEKKHDYYIKKDSAQKISLSKKIEDFQNYYSKSEIINSSKALDSLGYDKTYWNKLYYHLIVNCNKNIDKFKNEGLKPFIKTFTSNISISLFIFLPFFTLFLKLVYVRKKYTYIEHLVFVFHVQTVLFLLLSIFYLINLVLKTDAPLFVVFLLFMLYLYMALRNFYEQSRSKTIFKFLILNSFYLFLALIGFVIVSLLSFISS